LSVAILGSLFIYLSYFGYSNIFLETIFGTVFFFRILKLSSIEWFWVGFFIGVFWFWWLAVSFYYYGNGWAIPLIIIIVALIYGTLFFVYAKLSFIISQIFKKHQENVEIIIKTMFLFFSSYIHPFGFNWFKPELILVHTVFGVDKIHFGLFLFSILLFNLIIRGINLPYSIPVIFIFLSISLPHHKIYFKDPEGEILLNPTSVDVRDKWSIEYIDTQVKETLVAIDRAIALKKRAIVLPESVLPFFLNESQIMIEELKNRSMKIDIILGSLYHNKNENRNSIYYFHKGKFKVGDKIVLVPFGEENPLPNWLSGWVNIIFFDGAPDYTPAKRPTDFNINGKSYRGAICYEGTSDKIYENIPERLIVISNNGWFYPSIEPTLQKILFEYYVRVHKVRVYHTANYLYSYVIVP